MKKKYFSLSHKYHQLIVIIVIGVSSFMHGSSFRAEAYTSNNGIVLTYTISETIIDNQATFDPGQSIDIYIKITNNTDYPLRGFYFAEHVSSDLVPQNFLTYLDGNQIFCLVNPTTEEIYDETVATRWILETPPEFSDTYKIPKHGGFLEIMYTISCPDEGNYELSINNWVGLLDKEPVFGYNDANIMLVCQESTSNEPDPISPDWATLGQISFPWFPMNFFSMYQMTPNSFVSFMPDYSYLPYQSYQPFQSYIPYQSSTFWQVFPQKYNSNQTSQFWQMPIDPFDIYIPMPTFGGYWETPDQEYYTNYHTLDYWHPLFNEYSYNSLYWQIPILQSF